MNKSENSHQGGTVYDLTQNRAIEWLRRPCWSMGEIHLLLYGFDPVSKCADDFFPHFFRSGADNGLVSLKRAVTAGLLKPVGHDENGESVYSPKDVIQVAKMIEFGAWKDWEEWENLSQQKQAITIDDISPEEERENLSALFDPVPVEALEKMFPANGKWKSWAEKAKANGLIAARENGRFNPHKAAVWFVNRGMAGWDIARCYRVLANNLPARSLDKRHLLTYTED